jgi:hypothetical protein
MSQSGTYEPVMLPVASQNASISALAWNSAVAFDASTREDVCRIRRGLLKSLCQLEGINPKDSGIRGQPGQFVLRARTPVGTPTTFMDQAIDLLSKTRLGEQGHPAQMVVLPRDPTFGFASEEPIEAPDRSLLASAGNTARELAATYGWGEGEALGFLLSGQEPLVPLATAQLLKATTSGLSRIRLDLSPTLTREEVGDIYAEALRLAGAARPGGATEQVERETVMYMLLVAVTDFMQTQPQLDAHMRKFDRIARKRYRHMLNRRFTVEQGAGTEDVRQGVRAYYRHVEEKIERILIELGTSLQEVSKLCFANINDREIWPKVIERLISRGEVDVVDGEPPKPEIAPFSAIEAPVVTAMEEVLNWCGVRGRQREVIYQGLVAFVYSLCRS